jgi:hypothetical protein
MILMFAARNLKITVPQNRFKWSNYLLQKDEPVIVIKKGIAWSTRDCAICDTLYYLPLWAILDGTIPLRVLSWKKDWKMFPVFWEGYIEKAKKDPKRYLASVLLKDFKDWKEQVGT